MVSRDNDVSGHVVFDDSVAVCRSLECLQGFPELALFTSYSVRLSWFLSYFLLFTFIWFLAVLWLKDLIFLFLPWSGPTNKLLIYRFEDWLAGLSPCRRIVLARCLLISASKWFIPLHGQLDLDCFILIVFTSLSRPCPRIAWVSLPSVTIKAVLLLKLGNIDPTLLLFRIRAYIDQHVLDQIECLKENLL